MKRLFENKKRVCILAICAALVATLVTTAFFDVSAEMVNVYTKENTDFEMAHIYSEKAAQGWMPNGTVEKTGENSYSLKTNSWAFWLEHDSLDFAYNQVAFNTGKGSVLTAEVTLDSWDGTGTGSAGILLRNSLAADSEGVYLCVRDGVMFLMYRKNAGSAVNRGIEISYDNTYPISLRIVCDKSRNTATGYYKTASTWVNIGNVPYAAASQLFAGISAHSVNEKVFSECKFSDYCIKLDAPEGYTVEDGTGGGAEDIPNTEPAIILPEDMPTFGDALLSETFTDGNLFPEEDSQSVTNAYWTVREGEPTVMTNEALTNRYLHLSSLNPPLFMKAGDMGWTDYSTSVELYYPSDEVQLMENNNFTLLVRHTSAVLGGSFDYGVTVINKFRSNSLIGQFLQLNYRSEGSKFIPTYTTLEEVCLQENGMVAANVTHTLKVDAFDDTIKIYFDGELMIDHRVDWTDGSAKAEARYPNLSGCVGINCYGHNSTSNNRELLTTDGESQYPNVSIEDLNTVLTGDKTLEELLELESEGLSAQEKAQRREEVQAFINAYPGRAFRCVTSNFSYSHNTSQINIAHGQGAGQTRDLVAGSVKKIGSYTYFAVDTPFAVNPNRNSKAFVYGNRVGSKVLNCNFENGRHVGTYGTMVDAVFDGNIFRNSTSGTELHTNNGQIWYVTSKDNDADDIITGHTDTVEVKASGLANNSGSDSGLSHFAILYKDNFVGEGGYYRIDGPSGNAPAACDIVFEDNVFVSPESFSAFSSIPQTNSYDGFYFSNNRQYTDKALVGDSAAGFLPYGSSALANIRGAQRNRLGYLRCICQEIPAALDVPQAKGDVNNDGAITWADVELVRAYLAEEIELEKNPKKYADFTGNGTVDSLDVFAMRCHILGIEYTGPSGGSGGSTKPPSNVVEIVLEVISVFIDLDYTGAENEFADISPEAPPVGPGVSGPSRYDSDGDGFVDGWH